MIEYINCVLLVSVLITLFFQYGAIKKIISPYLKMTEAIESMIKFDDLLGPQQDENKKQKLVECVITGNSSLYLGKVYTEEQINKLNTEELEKLFGIYEAKLSGQMVKSLGKSIIHMYSTWACKVLELNNKEALSNDLENDPFLNSALQRLTCSLYYRLGGFLAPLSVGIITGRHYTTEKNIIDNNKNGGAEIRNNSSNDERPPKS